MYKRKLSTILCLMAGIALLFWGAGPAIAKTTPVGQGKGNVYGKMRSTTMAQRKAAAANAKAAGMLLPGQQDIAASAQAPQPGGTPDYFGPYPNYANSPLPMGPVGPITVLYPGSGYTAPVVTITDAFNPAASGATGTATLDANGGILSISTDTGGADYMAPVIEIADPAGTGAMAEAALDATNLVKGTGMRKFMDALPGLTVATPDTTTYPGSDYYEIEAREYTQKMHADLPPTRLRGYVQVKNGTDVAPISYLGPVILATRNKPVRVKFTNKLPTGGGGDLFIPVDTSYMGAGAGPQGGTYTQNRTTVHLHGATTPWISDGTPHQWITPAGENAQYPQGVSVHNVPDMPDPGPGSMTFFYTNQQSARLMFYHDHAVGLTRLNVYAGMAAGYLLTDPVDLTLINGGTITYTDPAGATHNVNVAAGTIPDLGIPLIIQDKTWVPNAIQLAAQDPTWNVAPLPAPADLNGTGGLWLNHVYMTNQNPYDPTGANAMGRWDYGPWFWPPFTNLQFGPVPNPYYDPANAPWEPPMIPGVPNISGTPENFMDTPVVNGMAYPTLTVDPKEYRFRILSVGNDKYLNLSLWVADPAVTTGDGRTNTEVKMVPFNSAQDAISHFPAWWYTRIIGGLTFDDRSGGVPDPATRGPAMIQIGTEGGVLPGPVVIKNQPVNYVLNKKDITVGNVKEHALLLGPAERADVIVDFTKFAGKTLILYNDAPSALPAGDPRLDYYTNDFDQVANGGAPKTLPGFGPNTRTIMQIKVTGTGGTAPVDDYNPATLAALKTALPAAFAATQDPIIVPQAAYNAVYGTNVVDTVGVNLASIQATSLTFTPLGQTAPVFFDLQPKSIIEDFQTDYGRMNAMLGVEIPHTNATNQTSIPQYFQDPPTEVVKVSDPTLTPIGTAADGTQIWKITHNGVDTHSIHFHMFTVQIVNRVGWDGAIRGPEPNELGFKDTVRMNPLEDCIVALRPIQLVNMPFKVPNSFRPLAPSLPVGATGAEFVNVDPNGLPVTVTNDVMNFGWEYVWHCHLLGHEENDMMRAMPLAVAPEIPINLTAALSGSGAGQKADLAWTDNSANETSFTIQKSGSTTGPWTNLATITSTSGPIYGVQVTYSDTVGAITQPVYYRVYASDTVGPTTAGYLQVTADSQPSNTAFVTPPVPPAAPTILTATLQAGPQILLNWQDNASNETGFVIERAVNGGAFAVLTTSGASAGTGGTVTYTDTAVSAGNTYAYRVAATNAGGNSAYSNTASVTIPGTGGPAAPTNLTATLQTGPQIRLSWRDNASNETGFVIERALNGGAFAVLTTRGASAGTGNTVTYTDTAVSAGNTYAYRVAATNAGGNSAYSNTASVTIPVPAGPAAPSNVTATGIRVDRTSDRIRVTWKDNSTNETGFRIQMARNATFTTGLITRTVRANAISFTSGQVSRNGSYYVRVQSYNGTGASAYVNATPFPLITP